MATNADNVQVAVTGQVLLAPVGTTLPTNTTTEPHASFDDVGYIHEDGVTESQPESTQKVKAWQNGDVVRIVRTEHDCTYQFTMIETTDVTLEAYYGNYAAGTVEINGDQLPHKSWILEVEDGEDNVRVVVPNGQITERGDVVYVNADAVGYPVTITCFPDDAGNKAYKYFEGAGS